LLICISVLYAARPEIEVDRQIARAATIPKGKWQVKVHQGNYKMSFGREGSKITLANK
jgi:hypothetical protein